MDQPLLAPPAPRTRPPLPSTAASWSRVIVVRSREIIIIFGDGKSDPRPCDRETSRSTLSVASSPTLPLSGFSGVVDYNTKGRRFRLIRDANRFPSSPRTRSSSRAYLPLSLSLSLATLNVFIHANTISRRKLSLAKGATVAPCITALRAHTEAYLAIRL